MSNESDLSRSSGRWLAILFGMAAWVIPILIMVSISEDHWVIWSLIAASVSHAICARGYWMLAQGKGMRPSAKAYTSGAAAGFALACGAVFLLALGYAAVQTLAHFPVMAPR